MKKSAVIGIVIVLFIAGIVLFLADSPVREPMEDAATEASSVVSENVKYFGEVTGYLAIPDDNETHPGLLLIHEWWGLNDNIREFAESFAEEGYVALAVDLYNGQSTTDTAKARELSSGVRNNMEAAFENLEAAVNFLKKHSSVNPETVASVGWCFGGGWSYEIAKNDLGVGASVIYYGQFNPEDDLSRMKTQMLGHFGEDDASIKVEDVRSLEMKLKTLSGEHQIFIYPNAGHAFANSDNEMSYVPEAAELSWMRTLEFLEKVF